MADRPKIGDEAMFWLCGALARGRIMDIRADEHDRRFACIAVLGWPQMHYVGLDQYQRVVDGVWRACLHERGFNAAGLCFDCLAIIGPSANDAAAVLPSKPGGET